VVVAHPCWHNSEHGRAARTASVLVAGTAGLAASERRLVQNFVEAAGVSAVLRYDAALFR
jgi:hypothetical protein